MLSLDRGKRLLGALLIAAPLAPVLAVILSVLSLAAWFGDPTVGQGLAWAAFINLMIAWAILAVSAMLLGLSTAKGALPATYGEISQWMAEIKAWLEHLNTEAAQLPSLYSKAAYWQLHWQYELIRHDLSENGSHWFIGAGYVNVWRRVHQAQELLIRLVSADALPFAARCELLRFAGSGITGPTDASKQLNLALSDAESGDRLRTERARDVIQAMRMTADQYRDRARSGLARTRSDATRTLTVTTMLSYALFWIVLEARFGYELASQKSPFDSAMAVLQMATGAAILFVWGAIIGLFGQLWEKWKAHPDMGEDDFGLAISWLVAVPVLAGLAGMAGVVVLTVGGPLLQSGLNGLLADPQRSASTLQDAFLPGTSPVSLLFAAIFALSPNLLISRLQQATANLQRDLRTSSLYDGDGATSGAK
jgi:hypothetical protein